MKIKLLILFLFITSFSNGQSKIINGQLIAKEDLEAINILNKTSKKFTTSDEKGRFEIEVSVNDSLRISALKYHTVDLVITQTIYNDSILKIQLTENINQLDEVVVGKVLSGNLIQDLNNSDVKAEINFYDLGIPGYTGLPPTMEERNLKNLRRNGGQLSLVGMISLLTGHTKKLKRQLKIAKKEACLNSMMNKHSNNLFATETLIDSLHIHFFYYATDDENFAEICKDNDLKQIAFLLKKLKAFKLIYLKEDEE